MNTADASKQIAVHCTSLLRDCWCEPVHTECLGTKPAELQVPVLETPTGSIWESNAIARYIARLSDSGLFGATSLEAVSPKPCQF